MTTVQRPRIHDRLTDVVGFTPMLRLSRCLDGPAPPSTEVFAKLEFLNPMGSIKDRVARHMVERALADGRLAPGGTVIESSSGNTGMGLAMMAVLHDLRCVLVVRRQTSREKLDALRALGAELVLVDGELPPEHPESYNQKARRLAAENPHWFFPDQHNNRENNEAHYLTTGPEIWQQTEGRLDYLVVGLGTGGTVSGTARYLKEQDPRVKVVAVDVVGSVFTDFFNTGKPCLPKPYRLEGLGDEEIIACPEFELIDDMVQVSDRQAFLAARRLARREAIFAGGSSGAVLWAVQRLLAELAARRGEAGGAPLGAPSATPAAAAAAGPRIVTVFCDSGNRYLSTLYNDAWMRQHGYLRDGDEELAAGSLADAVAMTSQT